MPCISCISEIDSLSTANLRSWLEERQQAINGKEIDKEAAPP